MEGKAKYNNYHLAALVYLLCATVVGIFLSWRVSPVLQAGGFFIIHSFIAFMGFGTLIIMGQQKMLVPQLLRDPAKLSGRFDRGFLVVFNVVLWCIWASYLARGLSGNRVFYYGAVGFGFVAMGCVAAFGMWLFRGISFDEFVENLPVRFFATSMLMAFLAYSQMVHVTINEISPVLPFSRSITLRNNYLAFSFPMSLTIMGTLYTPYYRKFRDGVIPRRSIWEAQYFILLTGVFSLFGAILFDTPRFHGFFVVLQTAFSAVLVASIVVFGLGVLLYRGRVKMVVPMYIWRYFMSALVYLSFAGLAGLALGYGVQKESKYYYFLIQSHVHLALLGWIAMGMTGAFLYLRKTISGESKGWLLDVQYYLMHAAMILMVVAIWYRLGWLRAASGVCFAAALVCLMVFTRERRGASA